MSQNTITLLDVNIEREKHVDAITALVGAKNPDVICFQEAQEHFVTKLCSKLGYAYQFSLRDYNDPETALGEPVPEGMMIAWHPKFTLIDIVVHPYNDIEAHFPKEGSNDVRRSLIVATLAHGGEIFRIGTTHFTWTPKGEASAEQRRDMRVLLDILLQYHDATGIVFSGDFNAPRHQSEIFTMMSSVYKDNLPADIMTTLDGAHHRAPLSESSRRPVDSIFSTKEYNITDVEVIGNVSDHMALFAKVSKSVC